MGIAINILISALVGMLSFAGAYRFMPLSWLETQPQKFGTTLVTIAGSDTLSASRTTINNNFLALNNGKIENSTTTLPLVTALSGLVTTGTLTSGALGTGFTAVPVSLGGTGTTSPSRYLVMLGNGANGLTIASTTGTTGQFLTSGGANAYPSWTTSAIDVALPYNFTGGVRFTSASTTIIGNLGVGTTSPYSMLSVAGGIVGGYFTATTTTSSIFPYASTTAITASGTASTTDLVISGTQTGGTFSYTASSTALGTISVSTTYTGSIPATANFGLANIVADGGSFYDYSHDITLARSGQTSATIKQTVTVGSSECQWTLSWSGANLVATENTDNCTLAGTFYWYK